jgi:hypothetical protein
MRASAATVMIVIARSMSYTLVPITRPNDSPAKTLMRVQAVLPRKTAKLGLIAAIQNEIHM